MAVSVVAGKTGSYTAGGYSTTWSSLGPGAGVAEGDVMVVAVVTEATHTISSVSAGWGQVGSTVDVSGAAASLSVFARRAGASDSGVVTVTFSVGMRATAAWCVLNGVDGTTMLDVAPVTGTQASVARRELSITTANANSGLLMINGCDPSSTLSMTYDAGITEVLDVNQSGKGHLDFGFRVQASAGATSMGGDWDTSRQGGSFLIAFREGSFTPPPAAKGWVRLSNTLRPEANERSGMISTSTTSGTSVGVSATIGNLPSAENLSLWLVNANTGDANGYELRIADGAAELRVAVDGESTVLDSMSSVDLAVSDVVEMALVDGIVAGIINATQVVYVADTSITGPWYAGVEGESTDLHLSAVGFGAYTGTVPEPELPVPPNPVTGLTLTDKTNGVVEVAFSMPDSGSAAGYMVRWKLGSGMSFAGVADGKLSQQGTAAPSAAVSYQQPGLAQGEAHTFAVWARDGDGTYGPLVSDTVTLAAAPPPPDPVVAQRGRGSSSLAQSVSSNDRVTGTALPGSGLN